jgi:serine O-acetyltransferase
VTVTFRSTLDLLKADTARYLHYDAPGAPMTPAKVLRTYLAYQGLQATVLFRVAHWARHASGGGAAGVVRGVLRAVHPVLQRFTDITTGTFISPDAEIGPGLYVAHNGGTIIGPIRMGANCNIGYSTTLGRSGRGLLGGVPQFGDRVVVAVGARVLGELTVGDDAMIGANSVVTRDVPARGLASGVPAKVVSHKGSFDYLEYPGMDQDLARAESLAAMTAQAGAPR